MATHQADCEICRKLAACRERAHPGLIAELDTGFAVLGDSQFFRGYSLLLCKQPVTELDELAADARARYLEEMAQLAAAVRAVVRPHKLNYEALGNQVHHMHWHVFPRQLTDPDPRAPVWGQMPQGAEADRHRLNPVAHEGLIAELRDALAAVRTRSPLG